MSDEEKSFLKAMRHELRMVFGQAELELAKATDLNHNEVAIQRSLLNRLTKILSERDDEQETTQGAE